MQAGLWTCGLDDKTMVAKQWGRVSHRVNKSAPSAVGVTPTATCACGLNLSVLLRPQALAAAEGAARRLLLAAAALARQLQAGRAAAGAAHQRLLELPALMPLQPTACLLQAGAVGRPAIALLQLLALLSPDAMAPPWAVLAEGQLQAAAAAAAVAAQLPLPLAAHPLLPGGRKLLITGCCSLLCAEAPPPPLPPQACCKESPRLLLALLPPPPPPCSTAKAFPSLAAGAPGWKPLLLPGRRRLTGCLATLRKGSGAGCCAAAAPAAP
jgi:hypothetical protein